MLIIDEYLAVDVVRGEWPADLPDEETLGLPSSRHFRLLQRLHNPSGGQLSAILERLSEPDRQVVRQPHPEVIEIIDPRPLLNDAAALGARFDTGGLLMLETIAAGFRNGRQLWFGVEANVGPRLRSIADQLGITVRVTSPP